MATPSPFASSVDVANAALKLLGSKPIASFADASVQATETAFWYDKLRRKELRRNIWTFSVRRAVLRATGFFTTEAAVPAWVSSSIYLKNDLALYNGVVWQRTVGWPSAQPTWVPGDDSIYWAEYAGPQTWEPWVSTNTYYAGDVAYQFPTWTADTYATGNIVQESGVWYQAQQTVTSEPAVAPATDWVVVSISNPPPLPWSNPGQCTAYISLVSNNSATPSGSPGSATAYWLAPSISGTLSSFSMVYPIGAGPSVDSETLNVYVMPYNFLREAPQDPKAGSTSFLGAPTGRMYDDWVFENGVLITRNSQPIIFRFAADIVTVPSMDPMFCVGLSASVAEASCERITQSEAKMTAATRLYSRTMMEARMVNGIEQGPTEPPEDDWITCRI